MNQKKLQKYRAHAFNLQHCRCYYCSLPMWLRDPAELCSQFKLKPRIVQYLQCSAEHLTAQMDGGGESPENIVAACLWCNSRRHRGRPTNAPSSDKYKAWVTRHVGKGNWHPAIASLARIVEINFPP